MVTDAIERILRWLRRGIRSRRRLRAFGRVIYVGPRQNLGEAPPDCLVLVGTPDKWKWLKLRCPCGCGEVLALNLMKSMSPSWSVEKHQNGALSVFPSVHALRCGAHFWLRQNRVYWC